MEGNFDSFPLDNHDKQMLKDAYDTITNLELWSWMKNPETPGKNGFMFCNAPEISQISKAMKFQGHSGASFGFTMRSMEMIAKSGWDAYVRTIPTSEKYRIAWIMPNGYTSHGEGIFDSRADATRFIEDQKERDARDRWSISYWVESI